MTAMQTSIYTDAQVQQMVEDELRWTPQIDSANIGVSVKDGAVTLTGEVDSFLWRHLAAKAALRVRGVRSVANDVTAKYSFSPIDDTDIAEAIQRTLRWTAGLPDGSIDAEVTNGNVILTGSVAWDSQRRAAEKQVRQIKGVHWVDDRVTLAPRVSSFEAHQHITDALKRNALTDAAHIDVAVDGTRVNLTGVVASYDELRAAERAAWSSPHVTDVRNDLDVQPR